MNKTFTGSELSLSTVIVNSENVYSYINKRLEKNTL